MKKITFTALLVVVVACFAATPGSVAASDKLDVKINKLDDSLSQLEITHLKLKETVNKLEAKVNNMHVNLSIFCGPLNADARDEQ